MSDEKLAADDPLKGTVDDPEVTDPYAHLRDKAKEQGTTETDTETETETEQVDDPDAGEPVEPTGDQAGY
jgi:hypothetical protein